MSLDELFKKEKISMEDGTKELKLNEYTQKIEETKSEIVDIDFPLQVIKKKELPSISEVDYKLAILKHVKKNVVSKSDYAKIKGKPYLTAAGCDKYIHFYRLNLRYTNRSLYKDDAGYHYEVDAILESPWSQIVEGHGTASMETMKLTKIRHNMIALAETRAKSRVVRTMMGLEDPGYAEMQGQIDEDNPFSSL